MKLGMRVRFSHGHIVLDGDPAPPPKMGAQPPIFGRYLFWPNGRPSELLTCSTLLSMALLRHIYRHGLFLDVICISSEIDALYNWLHNWI